MYDSILVPTDGSDHAARAATHAVYLAERFDATVHLLSAVDVDARTGPFSGGGVDEEFLGDLDDAAREHIEDTAAAITAPDPETAVVRGRVPEAIADYVDEHGIDLVATGTHGRTGVSRLVMGSVTERVVRTLEVPVLTVRATDGTHLVEGYDDLLISTDGSDVADRAVDHAIAVAEHTGARLHVLNVANVSAMTADPEYSMPQQVLSSMEAAGEDAVEAVATRGEDAGLDVVTEVRRGIPAEAIVDYADEAGIDLVAMATSGHTGLSRYLLGSTTEQVIRHCESPVLAVNASEEREA